MGIKGMVVVLYGITYVYFAISKILKFDDIISAYQPLIKSGSL